MVKWVITTRIDKVDDGFYDPPPFIGQETTGYQMKEI